MRSLAAAVLAFALVLPLVAGAAIPAGAAQAGVDAEADDEPLQTIEIRLQPNGDARFAVVHRIPLSDDAERRAFDQLATEFERGEHDIAGESFERIVDDVAAETGREMELRDVDRTTSAGEDVGTLTYSFTWTEFANRSGDRLQVGDAFHVDGEIWITTLSERQRLVIETPEGYEIESTTPTARPSRITDRALVWEGPRTFETGDVAATYQQRSVPASGLMSPIVLLGGGIAVAGAGLYAAWRYTGRRPIPGHSPSEVQSGDETPPGTTESPDASDGEPGPPVDPELISDEERVEHLLQRNGGRMKQAAIVKETGWSNAKVSQLLSEMNEDGQVEKLRIGRENLIALPDEDITDVE